MPSLKGTQTEKNLLKAFAGESQARNRYTFFAKQAAKEGYEQIAALFLETADNEGQHAKVFFKHLEGGVVEITATYPAGVIGDTAENLAGRRRRRERGVDRPVPGVRRHGRVGGASRPSPRRSARSPRSRSSTRRATASCSTTSRRATVFAKDEPVQWICRNCGYVHEGPKAPKVCPACDHPQAYQELCAENF